MITTARLLSWATSLAEPVTRNFVYANIVPLLSGWLILVLLAWAIFAAVCYLLDRWPRRGNSQIGAAYWANWLYARFAHRLRVNGSENIPAVLPRGGLFVVCNHTAGIDPSLVQAACPFEIRWMMAKDMMLSQYQWLWDLGRVIPVDRTSTRDTSSLRVALAEIEVGGAVGVFPEGKIESTPGVLLPFKAGVGVMIKKTGASVLPVFITGTPVSEHAWDSVLTFSNSILTFGKIRTYSPGTSSAEIVTDLENWFRSQT